MTLMQLKIQIQQVLMNILLNAIDAIGSDLITRLIKITLEKHNDTFVTLKTLNYTASEGMVLTFDFGTTAPINADEKISLRFYADGLWRYMASTTILTER